MRHMRLLRNSLLALFAVLLGQGVASAQSPGAPWGAAPAPQVGADQGVAPADASAGSARRVIVSPTEQVAESQRIVSGMSVLGERIRKQLEEARQKRDVVKTLCLDDKLSQLDVAHRSAEERRKALDAAASSGDADLANHEYTILSVLGQRTEQLESEANLCIGKEIGFVGESSVSMDVDPNMPLEDPSEYPTLGSIMQPPNCASCFK